MVSWEECLHHKVNNNLLLKDFSNGFGQMFLLVITYTRMPPKFHFG